MEENTTQGAIEPSGVSSEQPIVETKSEKLTEYDRVKRALVKANEEAKEGKLEPASDARSPEKKASAEERKETDGKEKSVKLDDKSNLKKGGDQLAEGDSKEENNRDGGKKAIPSRNLTKEERAALDKAPEILKQAFARREKELGNSANALNSKVGALEKELATTREKISPILKEAEEHARHITALLKRHGRDEKLAPEEYISKLMIADKHSREDPVSYILKFAEGNGVDLRELVTHGPELAFDSYAHKAQSEMARLQAELDYYKQQQDQQQQSYQRQQQQQTLNYVAGIAQEYTTGLSADEAEVFDTVSAQIFEKLESQARAQGSSIDYESLIRRSFEEALRYVPSAQQRRVEQERQAAQERVARASGVSYSPRAGTGAVQAAPTSLQDRIRQNARAMGILGR
jgi:hypothetical protein